MLSPWPARLAEKNGYTNVKVFHAGMPAWRQAGEPVMTTRKFVSDLLGYIVLIDTRGVEAAKAGHIQGAVAIAANEIVGEREQFPVMQKLRSSFTANRPTSKNWPPL